MVNGVPREVPRPKTLGAGGPEGFGSGTSRGTPFIMITTRLFHIMSFFRHPKLKKNGISFNQWNPWGIHWTMYECMKPYILVELNLNVLRRDVERMGYILSYRVIVSFRGLYCNEKRVLQDMLCCPVLLILLKGKGTNYLVGGIFLFCPLILYIHGTLYFTSEPY